MKKLAFIALFFAVMATSCNQGRIDELEKQNADILAQKQMSDSAHSSIYDYIIQIDGIIGQIKTKEKTISDSRSKNPERSVKLEEKIIQDLAEIQELMETNRKRINELENLRRKLNSSNAETAKLQELIAQLEKRVSEQEAEIESLKKELAIANERIEALVVENRAIAEENTRKQETIEAQTQALNTVFFCMGTERDLKANGVITKEGGFIGIGKASKINTEAISNSFFTKGDKTQMKRIETNSKKVNLVTPHTADSYKIDNSNPENLVVEITKPDEFWKSSKYLVIRIR